MTSSIKSIIFDEHILKIEDSSTPNVLFIGETKRDLKSQPLLSLTSQSIWRIARITTRGATVVTEVASGGKPDQIWDNRDSIFEDIIFPYSNLFSLEFDGANDYLEIPHSTTFNIPFNEPFSWSFWLKTTDGGSYTILEKASSNIGIRIYKLGSELLEVSWRGGGTGNRIRIRTSSAPSGILDGQWHHYVVTFNGTDANGMNIYEDSVLLSKDVLNDTLTLDPDNTANLVIGGRSAGTNLYDGLLDEVAFWDSELSASEITEIYNSGSPIDVSENTGNYVSSSNLLGWWRMGDGESDAFPIIGDSSTSSNDGTMINMIEDSIVQDAP